MSDFIKKTSIDYDLDETIVLDIFNKDNDLLKFYENLENHLKNL